MATPFQIMKSIIVKLEKSTETSKPADAGFLLKRLKRQELPERYPDRHESSRSAEPRRSTILTVSRPTSRAVTTKGNHFVWLLSVTRYPRFRRFQADIGDGDQAR